ncbi:DNA adenine methylase [Myxococcota bacterium]|nr:DNA adenine methylase [Myxococcota bacterium]
MPTPSPTTAPVDLFAALDGLTRQDGETPLAFRARLREQFENEDSRSGGALAAANLYRLRLGLDLLAERPPKGNDRLTWQRQTASVLGFRGHGARVVRELLAVAEAVQEARATGLAHGVPIEVLHRRFSSVRRSLRAFLDCGDPDGDVREPVQRPDQQRDFAVARLDRAAENAAHLLGPEWFREWLEAKQANLLRGSPARPPMTRGRRVFSSPLPYLGSKRTMLRSEIIPRLSRLLTSGTTLIDTHVGGGSVFLSALHLGLTDRVKINDMDPAVADFWTTVIRDAALLRSMVEARTVTEATVVEYLRFLRDTATAKVSDADRAERAYRKLVAHACTFAARGPIERVPYPLNIERWNANRAEKSLALRKTHALLRGRVVGDHCTSLDALDVLGAVTEGDVVFIDPPYLSLEPSGTARVQYAYHYTVGHHEALRDRLRDLDIPWLLTYGHREGDGDSRAPPSASKRHGSKVSRNLIADLYADHAAFEVAACPRPGYSAGNRRERGGNGVATKELVICRTCHADVFRLGGDNPSQG